MSYIEFNSGDSFLEIINNQEDGNVIINHDHAGITDVILCNNDGEYINVQVGNGGHVLNGEILDIYTDIVNSQNPYETFYDSETCEQLLELEERIDQIGDVQVEYVDSFNLHITKDFGGLSTEQDWATSVLNQYGGDCQIIINVITESGRGNKDYEIYTSDIYNYNPISIEGLFYENPIPVNEKVYIKLSINWDVPGWQHVEGEVCGIAQLVEFNLDLYGGPTPQFLHNMDFVSYRPGNYGIFYVCPTYYGIPVYLDIYEVAESGLIQNLYPIGIYACEGPVNPFDLTLGYKEISINLICLCEYTGGGLTGGMFPWKPYSVPGDDLYENGLIKSKFYLSSRDAYNTYDGFERTQSWINYWDPNFGFTNQSNAFNKFFSAGYNFSYFGFIELYSELNYNYVPTIGLMHIVFEDFRPLFDDAINILNSASGWTTTGFPFNVSMDLFDEYEKFMSSTPSPYELGAKVWASCYDEYVLSEYNRETGKSDYVTDTLRPVLVCTDFTNVDCYDYRN